MMVPMAEFVPGLQLNEAFYTEVVAPLMTPWPHAAARLGFGSDVLGLDTERSTDHGWGPHVVLLVEPDAVDDAIHVIDRGLPVEFRGWPVRYGWDDHPVRHYVVIDTLSSWLGGQLGVDPTQDLRNVEWLLIPQQKLLEVTSGAVYRDDTGELTRVREALSWYPPQVWLWMIASQWRRIAQEEAFVGRAAEVGDDLGSRLVVSRLVRELMRLWFLFHRRYWPYMKWFGTMFDGLPDARSLSIALEGALSASGYTGREAGLVNAYELVAERHDALGITDTVDPQVRLYHERPYRVLMADRFADACLARIDDPELIDLPLLGSVDQVSDSTDLLSFPRLTHKLRPLYKRLD
jgi:hypothetical protein